MVGLALVFHENRHAHLLCSAFVTEMCLFFSVIAGLQQDCNTEGRPGQESMKQSRPHAEEDFGQQ